MPTLVWPPTLTAVSRVPQTWFPVNQAERMRVSLPSRVLSDSTFWAGSGGFPNRPVLQRGSLTHCTRGTSPTFWSAEPPLLPMKAGTS